MLCRDAGGGGGAGGHVPPQVLGYQLTLFGPRGADYARHITTCPPIFSDDAASLINYNQDVFRQLSDSHMAAMSSSHQTFVIYLFIAQLTKKLKLKPFQSCFLSTYLTKYCLMYLVLTVAIF